MADQEHGDALAVGYLESRGWRRVGDRWANHLRSDAEALDLRDAVIAANLYDALGRSLGVS